MKALKQTFLMLVGLFGAMCALGGILFFGSVHSQIVFLSVSLCAAFFIQIGVFQNQFHWTLFKWGAYTFLFSFVYHVLLINKGQEVLIPTAKFLFWIEGGFKQEAIEVAFVQGAKLFTSFLVFSSLNAAVSFESLVFLFPKKLQTVGLCLAFGFSLLKRFGGKMTALKEAQMSRGGPHVGSSVISGLMMNVFESGVQWLEANALIQTQIFQKKFKPLLWVFVFCMLLLTVLFFIALYRFHVSYVWVCVFLVLPLLLSSFKKT